MPTLCRAYASEEDARAAVDRVLAAGVEGHDVLVLMGERVPNAIDEPVGEFGGTPIGADDPVGAFAGAPGSLRGAMGAFAGDPETMRHGGFGDADRETVTSDPAGVRRSRVVSHARLERLLVESGLDAEAARTDVRAVHAGRVLVLVTVTTGALATTAESALDAA